MKNLIIALFLCFMQINVCNGDPLQASQKEKLYIKTVTITGWGSEQVTKEVITEVTNDYFEIKFFSGVSDSDGRTAITSMTDLVKSIKLKGTTDFKHVYFTVVNKDGSQIKFTAPTEFLNFMSARGYELFDQTKNKFSIDYTFKKKQ